MLTVFAKSDCSYCALTKKWLDENAIPYEEIDIMKDQAALDLVLSHGHRTVPQIYLEGEVAIPGGYHGLRGKSRDDIMALLESKTGRAQ